MDYRAVIALAALLALLLLAFVRYRRRAAGGSQIAAARERALVVTEAALETYRIVRAQDPGLGSEELKVRVLVAASGEPEAQVRGRIEKARGLSPQHATLQMLLVGVAVRKERALEEQVGSEQLMRNIVEAQKVVMGLIPADL